MTQKQVAKTLKLSVYQVSNLTHKKLKFGVDFTRNEKGEIVYEDSALKKLQNRPPRGRPKKVHG